MAQIPEGENLGNSRGFVGNAPPRLPPKFPVNRGSSSSEIDTPFYNSQITSSPVQHTRMPSHSTEFQEQPFWLNELLEESDGPSRRGSHRRSASDSFTYLGNPGSLFRFSNIAEEDESECNTLVPSQRLGNEDGDQLTDLLDEIQQLQNQQNLPISARTQPISSKFDRSNANKLITSRTIFDSQDQLVLRPKGETVKELGLHGNVIGGSTSLGNCGEANADPKQAKRVLSNRQSAQRSRVRKLQYIAELERIVNGLQMDVSSLSTQMLYIQHQQALLDMDNSTLKQRIAFCLQEKSMKDSENEALINDVRRLQKVSEFQVLHQQQKHKQQQLQRRNIHRHSSLPSDFAVQMQQYSESNVGPCYSPSDSLAGLMKNMSNITLNAAAAPTSEVATDGARTTSLEGGNTSASSSIK